MSAGINADIRAALRGSDAPLSLAQLADACDWDAADRGQASKNLSALRKTGEVSVTVEDGKPHYTLNPEHSPKRESKRTGKHILRQSLRKSAAAAAPTPEAPRPFPATGLPPRATPAVIAQPIQISQTAHPSAVAILCTAERSIAALLHDCIAADFEHPQLIAISEARTALREALELVALPGRIA